MKRSFQSAAGVIALCLAVSISAADSKQSAPIEKRAKTGPTTLSKVTIVTNVAFLGAGRAEKLDLYLPQRESQKPLPAFVWIHGGGLLGGTKDESRAREICSTMARAGYVAASIDYRLGAGAWPQNLFDCKNAVRFLRANAGKYNVDVDRIAVAGGSAGGYLALMVGFTEGKKDLEPEDLYPGVSSSVRCVVNMYGIANLLTRRDTDAHGNPTTLKKVSEEGLRVFGAASRDDDVLRFASPVTHAARGCPPVLILHGRADTTVDYLQSEELARVLKERSVEHEIILLEGVGHTFTLESWKKKPLPRDLRPVMLDFVGRHTRQQQPGNVRPQRF